MALIMYFAGAKILTPLEAHGHIQDFLAPPLTNGETRYATGQISASSESLGGLRSGGKTHVVGSSVVSSRPPPPIGALSPAEIVRQTPSPPIGGPLGSQGERGAGRRKYLLLRPGQPAMAPDGLSRCRAPPTGPKYHAL